MSKRTVRVVVDVDFDEEKWLISAGAPEAGESLHEDVANYLALESGCSEHLRGSAAKVRLVRFEPVD